MSKSARADLEWARARNDGSHGRSQNTKARSAQFGLGSVILRCSPPFGGEPRRMNGRDRATRLQEARSGPSPFEARPKTGERLRVTEQRNHRPLDSISPARALVPAWTGLAPVGRVGLLAPSCVRATDEKMPRLGAKDERYAHARPQHARTQ